MNRPAMKPAIVLFVFALLTGAASAFSIDSHYTKAAGSGNCIESESALRHPPPCPALSF
jgi:hypothetical protein